MFRAIRHRHSPRKAVHWTGIVNARASAATPRIRPWIHSAVTNRGESAAAGMHQAQPFRSVGAGGRPSRSWGSRGLGHPAGAGRAFGSEQDRLPVPPRRIHEDSLGRLRRLRAPCTARLGLSQTVPVRGPAAGSLVMVADTAFDQHGAYAMDPLPVRGQLWRKLSPRTFDAGHCTRIQGNSRHRTCRTTRSSGPAPAGGVR